MIRVRAALAIVVTALCLAAQIGCSSNSSTNNGNPDAASTPSEAAAGPLADGSAADAGAAGEGGSGGRVDGGGKEVVFANSGLSLNVFDLNPTDGTLTSKASMPLAQTLQVADFDPAFKRLYVGATLTTSHYLYAYGIDQSSGLLTALSAPVVSPRGRVINLSVSGDSKYFLAVHNVTRQYSVINLASDGSIGAEVPQADGGDSNLGAYLHQIRTDPSGQYVIVCDRGNDPATIMTDAGAVTTPEDIGHLFVFSFSSGVMTLKQTITFPAGIGPRHLDFHPTKPWVYLAAERGNRLITYTFQNGTLTEAFNTSSLAVPTDATRPNQRAGEIKVDSSGAYLWVTNRNLAMVPDPGGVSPEAGADAAGAPEVGADAAAAPEASLAEGGPQDAAPQDAGVLRVFAGGENNIALFAINPATGEPTFVAATESHGFEPRSFAVDASRNFLIVGNQRGGVVRQGSTLTTFATNLSVFRLAADGRPTFLKSYDQTSGDVLWVGSSALSGP